MPHISVVTGCFNEAENVERLYEEVKSEIEKLANYTFEIIFIDNCSTDDTVRRLRELAKRDSRVRVIVNARNFGHIRSPYYALLQSDGDVTIGMASDLQEPPALIPEFIKKWEEGYKIVAGVKTSSDESFLMYLVRSTYYRFVKKLSDVDLVEHFTGFGLYDRRVVDILRSIEDPYPYLRGLVSEIGYEIATVPFKQPLRKAGKSKSTLLVLYDMALLGITTHSRAPMRLASFTGFVLSAASALVGFGYLIAKLLFWNQFQLGLAPLVIGVFMLSSAILFFVGVLGEYVLSIQQYVRRLPLVVERERINFPADRQLPRGRPVAPGLSGPRIASNASPAASDAS
ncbi:MAG TPA: glycosyltransferase family 2 protein [Labilithrix sp.]|nr:glycosyltransferase family 2 protein [Labilithrix sp.]